MPGIMPLKLRNLYGGAIRCALPVSFFDVSDLREIPSTQEVFAHPNTDQSIIFDLLEYQRTPDESAVLLHFEQIGECNDATTQSEIVQVQQLSNEDIPALPNVPKYLLVGKQSVAKFNEADDARNGVAIHMVLIRLAAQETDIVITLNSPVAISAGSSSAGMDVASHAQEAVTPEIFRQIIHSVNIVDYSLFDG